MLLTAMLVSKLVNIVTYLSISHVFPRWRMAGCLHAFVLVLSLALASAGKLPPDNRLEELTLSRVTREVDLTTPLVKEKVTFVVKNDGNKSVSYVMYTVESHLANNVAYINAQVSHVRSCSQVRVFITYHIISLFET